MERAQSCIGISYHSSTVCKLSTSTVYKLSLHCYAPCNSIILTDLSHTR